MKTLSFALVLAVPFVTAACAGNVVDGRPSGTGGGASITGGAGSGGKGGGGAGGADGGTICEALIADLTVKIADARVCAAVGTWDPCPGKEDAVGDECGCPAPVNHENAAAVDAATAASAAVVAAGCASVCDYSFCASRYNDPDYQGGCVPTGPNVGVCAWAGAD